MGKDYKMSSFIVAGNRKPPPAKAVCTSKDMLSTPRLISRESSQSWSDSTNMAPNDTKMANSNKVSTPRSSGNKGFINGNSTVLKHSKSGSKSRSSSTERKGVLGREKMSNGLSSNSKISINIIDDDDSDIDEERDNVFSPIGDKPLISILKMPGSNRARSQSLPPNMILQQLSEGVASLGPNSKLAGLLKQESSEEGSMESLAPPGYMYAQRKVSFSIPHSDDGDNGCSSPSQLFPPLSGRLSPGLVCSEHGGSTPRRCSPFSFDLSSTESLDSDHRRSPKSTRPSTAPKDSQRSRLALPTGSSIFQRAMAAEVSDSSDKNSDSSDSDDKDGNEDRSRSKKNKHVNRATQSGTKISFLSPANNSSSTRRVSNSAASPRRSSQSGASPRRPVPSSGVSPRRPSKSDASGSRRT